MWGVVCDVGEAIVNHIQPYSIALNELFVECRHAERVPLFMKVVAMFHASPIFYSSIFYPQWHTKARKSPNNMMKGVGLFIMQVCTRWT